MRAILTLAAKDLRLLLRDTGGMIWVLLFPVVVAVLFGFMFSGGDEAVSALPVAVVDADDTPASRAFTLTLGENPALEVVGTPLEPARAAVRRGERVAAVILPPGFGAAVVGGGVQVPVDVLIDPTRRAEVGILQGLIMQAFLKSGDAAARQDSETPPPGINAEAAEALGSDVLSQLLDSPVDLPSLMIQPPEIVVVPVTGSGQEPRSAFEVSFPSGMLWGLIASATAFAVSVVRERTGGTLLRLYLAPLSRAEILAGKGLACFVTCVIQMFVLALIGAAVFDVRLDNFAGVAAAIAACALCFVGLMMMLSQIGRSEMAVNGGSWALMLVFAMFGGAMVPSFLMPEWMQTIGLASPVTWGIKALEGAMWRGLSWPELAEPLAVLCAIGLAGYVLGVALLRARRA